MITEQLKKLKRKRDFQAALKSIYDSPEGKVFFKMFLEQCGVTKPRFSKDPYDIVWGEALRHLAMSYLRLLGEDDTQILVNKLEESFDNEDRKDTYDE